MSNQIPERFTGGAVDLSHLASRGQQPSAGAAAPGAAGQAAGRGQIVDVPALVFDVTDQTFEQAAQLSAIVPVIFHLRSDSSEASLALDAVLTTVIRELDGQALLGQVDVHANPGLAQAFQVQAVPAVIALLAGRPVPLFQGAASEPQVRDLIGQLLQLAQQQGVTGRANAPEQSEAPVDGPVEPPVNPAHVPALEALEQGDYATAEQEYERVLAKAPADHEARAALVQVRMLHRLEGVSAAEIRQAAGDAPTDIDAQMRVADLDVSGGHVEDAFLRLLDLFSASDVEADRTRIRERLLELFEVVGLADPRVNAARGRLANLLY